MRYNGFRELRLTVTQRRILLLGQVGVLSLYLITNRLLSHLGGGTTFEIWLDQYIPFWPIWVVPYVLAIVWWGVALLWAFLKMQDSLYAPFSMAWIITCLAGYSFFVLYPNYMIRPQVNDTGWAAELVRFVYANDRTYNAFPSQHLWNTVVISLFWSRWKPGWRWALWGSTVIIALSTLFTGQHWIMDAVGGSLLAVIGYFLGGALAARVAPILSRLPSQAGN